MYKGKNITIDLWYSDTLTDCDSLTCSFSDMDCVYRGNIVKNGRFVGDYTARNFQAVEDLYSRMKNGSED